jgi:hypothetical protein
MKNLRTQLDYLSVYSPKRAGRRSLLDLLASLILPASRTTRHKRRELFLSTPVSSFFSIALTALLAGQTASYVMATTKGRMRVCWKTTTTVWSRRVVSPRQSTVVGKVTSPPPQVTRHGCSRYLGARAELFSRQGPCAQAEHNKAGHIRKAGNLIPLNERLQIP